MLTGINHNISDTYYFGNYNECVPWVGIGPPQSKTLQSESQTITQTRNDCPLNLSAIPVLHRAMTKLMYINSKAIKDGGCLRYIILNNENYNVCLPPYLWINKTQFGKKKTKTNEYQILTYHVNNTYAK